MRNAPIAPVRRSRPAPALSDALRLLLGGGATGACAQGPPAGGGWWGRKLACLLILYLLVVALVIPLVIAAIRSARLRCLVSLSSFSQKVLASRKRWLCSSLS